MTFIFIIEKFQYRTKNTRTKTNELEETKFKELNVLEQEKKILCNIPCVSQLSPENPSKHVHVYDVPTTEHVPLFSHGFGKHGESAG